MINKTYVTDVFCKNCGKIMRLTIPQELSVEEYLEQNDFECENCTFPEFKVYYME